MQIKVVATKMGYWNNIRIKEGSVFFMDENALRKAPDGTWLKDDKGNLVLPLWVKAVEEKQMKSAKGSKVVTPVMESEEVI
jgi:hypothetical protein